MIRETLNAGATMAFVDFDATSYPYGYYYYRTTTGSAGTYQTLSAGIAAPYWLMLRRSGNTFSEYSPQNGGAPAAAADGEAHGQWRLRPTSGPPAGRRGVVRSAPEVRLAPELRRRGLDGVGGCDARRRSERRPGRPARSGRERARGGGDHLCDAAAVRACGSGPRRGTVRGPRTDLPALLAEWDLRSMPHRWHG